MPTPNFGLEFQVIGQNPTVYTTNINNNWSIIDGQLAQTLTDVQLTTVQSGDVLIYDLSGGVANKWSNYDYTTADIASKTTADTHYANTVAHGATGAVVGTTNTQSLTNKTLIAPIISTISNTGTLTLPTSTDTLIGRSTTDTLSNKSLSDSTTYFIDNVDITKRLKFELSGITTSTDRVVTIPDRNIKLDTFTTSSVFTQGTTPSNPLAGTNKLYFKADNKLYSLTSDGTEQEVGAGAGGGGDVDGGNSSTQIDAIQWRRDTDANWAANNPILDDGEVGYLETSRLAKIGDGVTPFNSLPYLILGSAESGESNTASNVGGYFGVFNQKSGVDLQFKTLQAGANLVIADNGDYLTISALSTVGTSDSTFTIDNASDPTKKIGWDASGITTGNTRTITMKDGNVDLSVDALTTHGDILYRDATGYQRLPAGTSGQVLETQGAGANPQWVDAGGGLEVTSTQTVATGENTTAQKVATMLGDGVADYEVIIGTEIDPSIVESFAGSVDVISTAKLDNNRILICYADDDNTGFGTAIIAETDSSAKTISFGHPIVFESADVGGATTSCSALSSEKAIVCYRDGGNTNQGTAVILDIVGTNITVATPVVFETGSVLYVSVTTLDSTKALVCYEDDSNSDFGTACVLDVSGSTITPGTPTVYESDSTAWHSVTTLTSTKVLVAYQDQGNSSQGTAIILDISGSTITPATPVVFETGDSREIKIDTIDSTKAIVSYRDVTNSGFGTACILDISGSTITPATPVAFTSTTVAGQDISAVSNDKAIVAYRDNGNNNYGTSVILDISGSVITANLPVVFAPVNTNLLGYSIENIKGLNFLVCYDNLTDTRGDAQIIEIEATIPENYIGVSTETKTSTQSVIIAYGHEIDGFSGLTQGVEYYIADDGTLTTTPENGHQDPVCVALSTTKVKWNGGGNIE